jgi:hypothetical protein
VQATAGAFADIAEDLGESGGFVEDWKLVADLRRGMPRLYAKDSRSPVLICQ